MNGRFLIGIDSDGTVFDSMTIKHRLAFIPCMIEVFSLGAISDKVSEIAEYINLYSSERGINRFPGLVRTFEEIEKRTDFPLEDYSDLRAFVNDEKTMSNAALSAYECKNNSDFLKKVLLWSEKSDIIFAKKMSEQPPFKGAKDFILTQKGIVDLAIISSASSESLKEDWGRCGLLEHMKYTQGQEMGQKAEQLASVIQKGYSPERCLMIGDAVGDLEAAEANSIAFYPILPMKEEESWELFEKKYFPMFINGEFPHAQNELNDKLLRKREDK